MSHTRGGFDRLEPLGREVRAVQIVPALVQRVLGDDVGGQAAVGKIQRDRVARGAELLDTRAELRDHGGDGGLQAEDAGFGEEGILGLPPQPVVLVVDGAEVGLRGTKLSGVVGVFVAWGRPGVERLVEVWVVDVELVRADADDGTLLMYTH